VTSSCGHLIGWQDGNGVITYDEWRDFLLLYPLPADLGHVFHFYTKGGT
jgi:hypothetical protein